MKVRELILSAFLISACSSLAFAEIVTNSELSESAKRSILQIISPAEKRADAIIAKIKPAENLDELKGQLETLYADQEFEKAYKQANLQLDKQAVVKNFSGSTGAISNFAPIVQGIYRSANPTLEQVQKVIKSKEIDDVIALNIELDSLTRMDPGNGLPLTAERKKAIEDAFLKKGKTAERAKHEIEFYEKHLTYAQAIKDKEMPNLHFFGLDHPKDTIKLYFSALEEIKTLRGQNKKVLIHCSVGKHRTGLTSILVKALADKGDVSSAERNKLYIEFVERNWNERAETRIHYMLVAPLIIKSKPFQKLAQNW